ncbi:hypothetical protein KEC16_10040 [Magnetospirillum sp. J10]|uniref:Uncharacterized protein n=2 Tax=Magnetospirillum sulfuroxidans TaxID=611300 RepID=A0ABS5ICA3_9PROT|nr:hypothetical protein [Magnetospirillum sulfuroxidans]
MTPWFRTLFLFSSFGPLYVLFAASLYVQGVRLWWGGVIAFAMAVIVFLWLKSRFKRKSVIRKAITVESNLDEGVFSYLVSYFPPFMTDSFSDPAKAIPIVIFYATMVFLLFRSSTIYINPFFIASGYRLYRGRLEGSNRSIVLITNRQDIIDGDMLSLYEVHPSRLYFGE